MGDTRQIGRGLGLLYQGNMIALIAGVCSLLLVLIPLGFLAVLAMIAIIVAGVICLVGLVRLSKLHDSYMKALIATLLGMVFSLLSNDSNLFGSLMNIGQSICSLAQVYFVIQGTRSFLEPGGHYEQIALGNRAWKWQLIGVAISVVTIVFAFVVPPLAVVLLLAASVVFIIALVIYLTYLKAGAAVLS